MKKLEEYVRSIPDFPEPGIIFRDITTILQDADGLQLAIDGIQKSLEGVDYDIVVGPESRGFIFGVPVAYAMHKGFVPIRKKGKLPCKTVSVSYDLEYGSAVLEMHEDAIKPGQKVVIVDDLIATGGTTEAIVKLIEKMGGEVVKICCVMEQNSLPLHFLSNIRIIGVFYIIFYFICVNRFPDSERQAFQLSTEGSGGIYGKFG